MRFNRRENKKEYIYDKTFRGSECVDSERLCASCYEDLKDVPPLVGKNVKVVRFVGEKRKKPYKRPDRDKNDKTDLDLKGLKDKLEKGR
jgi:hypothetical protein